MAQSLQRQVDDARSSVVLPRAELSADSARTVSQKHVHDDAGQQPKESYDVTDSNALQSWANLDELAAVPPLENRTEAPVYSHTSLEGVRNREREILEPQQRPPQQRAERSDSSETISVAPEPSNIATQIYMHSYLVFFSILGTLARKGIAALTTYPGTPVSFNTIWANFTGCLIMGFLVEDRKLFLHEWGSPTYHEQILMQETGENCTDSERGPVDLNGAKKAFMSTKKSIPLYVGLTTGLCGSMTTFSEFILDAFLALSNQSPPPISVEMDSVSRNGGYSFMALVGVIVVTVCLSLSGLKLGAHLAVAMEKITPPFPFALTRRCIDPLVVFLGWGSWAGAILLCVLPPHEFWRGRVTFALVFAPLGVLMRFYLALYLNSKISAFPVGTFAANIFASVVVATVWDLSHAAVGGVIGCQVLQGIDAGFCGCLSTVSTWVAELTSLERKHSYFYGSISVLTALGVVVIIAGSVTWTIGTHGLLCST